ncbi:AbrB family transcriptional regulator [Bacillus piscicola]|uniref:AbrB family transcriptional regulator n=1 Tax=Bacillus piscicola TaxID=1632684 RepID=UPI001F0A004D|nr:AbrB family transcriptional regulator [Bacillus piscicola]
MNRRAFTLGRNYVVTGVASGVGGLLFMLLHIPVPWLLGPMVAMVIGTNMFPYTFRWHPFLRNIGLVIVGYTIGLSMTAQALHDMALQLPIMLLMTLLLLLLCSIIAFVISKISDSDFHTSLLASIPGGLSQVLLLAEETKGVNLAVVTITQIIRLMLIILSMPLLVLLPFFKGTNQPHTSEIISETTTVSLFPTILLFMVAAFLAILVLIKIRFPTAFLLGPIVGTVLLQLGGMNGPELPDSLIHAAQFLIGTHVGLMLHLAQLPNKMRTISLAFASGMLLVAGSILLSFLLTSLQPLDHATGLLSLAPGGMDQMGVIAHEIHADLSIVSGYQLFRTLFIFFAIPPIIKWFFYWVNNKHKKDSQP